MVVDFTDFETGMNGWEFKFWMPTGRLAEAKLVDGKGYLSPHCLQMRADGSDDDGIFFLQKVLRADIEGPFTRAAVAWALWDETVGSTTTWPRVAYIGEPQDLANQNAQKKFRWFHWEEGLSRSNGWYGQMYRVDLDPGLDDLQICIGWKINWETPRTLLMDNILLQAM